MRTNTLYRLTSLITLLCCIGFGSITLFAKADTKVVDQANLFTLDETEKLEALANDLAEKYQIDIGIVTTNDAEGKSAQEYADDFYDNNGYGYGKDMDGLLYLIDMDNREIYLSTCGLAIQYFTDLRISKLLDLAYTYVSNEDYYGSAIEFLKDVETHINTGVVSNQKTVEKDFSDPRVDYNDPNMTEASSKHIPFRSANGEPLNAVSVGLSALVSLLLAALIAFIIRFIVQYRYKHPSYTVPEAIPDDSSVHYTERTDRFVTSHTTRTKIEHNDDNGSSGGSGISSVHSSSSGTTHGGGGRSF